MIEWRPAIRALIYCIQFDDDPTQSVDLAMETVVEEGALGLEPDGYREAIASALASSEPLAGLVPHDHSEDTIRRFLELLRDRLRRRTTNAESPGPSLGWTRSRARQMVLESDDAELYRLIEEEDGKLALEIVLGEVGWYEMKVPLTTAEVARYRDEGRAFLKWLIARVRASPGDYRR